MIVEVKGVGLFRRKMGLAFFDLDDGDTYIAAWCFLPSLFRRWKGGVGLS